MSNPNPVRPKGTVLFKNRWRSGKTIQQRLPIAIKNAVVEVAQILDVEPEIAPCLISVAYCMQDNPAIAKQVLEFAQSLLAE